MTDDVNIEPTAAEMASLGAALDALLVDVASRADADPASSYTAKLISKGALRIAKKIGEEAVELALALAAQEDHEVVSEAADLLYHLAVGLHLRGVDASLIGAELTRRRGLSGLVEKARRKYAGADSAEG